MGPRLMLTAFIAFLGGPWRPTYTKRRTCCWVHWMLLTVTPFQNRNTLPSWKGMQTRGQKNLGRRILDHPSSVVIFWNGCLIRKFMTSDSKNLLFELTISLAKCMIDRITRSDARSWHYYLDHATLACGAGGRVIKSSIPAVETVCDVGYRTLASSRFHKLS